MAYHAGATPAVREAMERRKVTDDSCWACLLSKVTCLFTDKTQMELLNPGGPNPEGDRYSGEDGPVVKVSVDRPSWEDWKRIR